MKRLVYLDNVKLTLIFLVVLTHVALAFAEESPIPNRLYYVSASYIMGLFFFISGYFLPSSYDRCGLSAFLKNKLIRLGGPVIVFTLATSQIYSLGAAHLWYLTILMIFSIAYSLVRYVFPQSNNFHIQYSQLLVFLVMPLFIGLACWFIRRYYPTERWVVKFYGLFLVEPARFPQYIVMFISGILSYRSNFLESICLKNNRIPIVMGVFLYILYFFIPLKPNQLWFCVFESFFCILFNFAILTFYKHYLNRTNAVVRWMSDQSYGVYIVHVSVLLIVYYLIDNLAASVYVKFILLSISTIIGSFFFSWLLRLIPCVKRIM